MVYLVKLKLSRFKFEYCTEKSSYTFLHKCHLSVYEEIILSLT